MYKSVFSMLIAAKAAEIKSNSTRTEILSEEQWLRKLIDGKKPIEWGGSQGGVEETGMWEWG